MSFTHLRAEPRERLTSAAAALALQAGLFALLALSFEAVRHISEEKESFIILPPLARPLPQQKPAPPMPRRKPITAPPPAAAPAPSPADSTLGSGGAGLGPAQPAGGVARQDGKAIKADPDRPVKNAPIWQSEIERRNTPPRVPCVALTNNVIGLGGFQKEDHGARLDLGCALKALRDGPALLPPVQGGPDLGAPRAHASDDAFKKALQAVNDRKRALYPRAAPPPDAQTGAAP